MAILDMKAISATPLVERPFNHLAAPNLLGCEALSAIEKDFPDVPGAGIFPLSGLSYGPSFTALISSHHQLSGIAPMQGTEEDFGPAPAIDAQAGLADLGRFSRPFTHDPD